MSEINWVKAPDWADRVVRGGTLNLDYWADDCKLQPVNNSCPPFKTNNHIREDFLIVERRPTVDTGIDWSKAPHWADRVVRSPRQRQLFWADDNQRKRFKDGCHGVCKMHIRDNWEVVERRPTVNTGIDWSKAPHWADRVVRLPGMRHLYWADDTQRQSVEHGRYRKDNDHVKARWEVVERRFLDDPHLPPKTFNCKCAVGYRTIEQRIASLRALEKQVEETRSELTRDLEALGLMWMVRDEPEQPTITDWRDLRVGDVIWIGDLEGNRDFKGECTILELDIDDDECPFRVIDCNGNDTLWPSIRTREWRFIRRP